ncbi:MAG: hypothetical protein R3D25_02780 [Geminicoccaceae bacterium]
MDLEGGATADWRGDGDPAAHGRSEALGDHQAEAAAEEEASGLRIGLKWREEVGAASSWMPMPVSLPTAMARPRPLPSRLPAPRRGAPRLLLVN